MEYPEKQITISPSINSAPLMAKLTIKPIRPTTKQKQDRPANSVNE